MLIKLLVSPIWLLLDFLCEFLPAPVLEFTLSSDFYQLIGKGIAIMGVSNFVMLMGSVMFWYGVQLTWAVIEWLYSKIPGVS